METTFYLVGGAVRDLLMGFEPKDYDYSVEAESYEAMREAIEDRGGKIFVETPEMLTIRALDTEGEMTGIKGMATDFVLCRSDGIYEDSRHPENVEPGTLFDDLERRDFTMNAIAVPAGGSFDVKDIIDPHNGFRDIKNRSVHCVGDPLDRFREDALRVMRAFRFSITLGFNIAAQTQFQMFHPEVIEALRNDIPAERKRMELDRCFRADTNRTIGELGKLASDTRTAFIPPDEMWLKPTQEKR